MKHIKKFNESNQPIQKVDKQSIIDEILDSLKEKGKLSKSEKEFMIDASNDKINDVTIPKTTGNFWADMSNPHNLGTMWQNKNGIWKQLIPLDDEKYNKLSDDEKWEYKKKKEQLKYIEKYPELKPLLNKLAIIHHDHDIQLHDIIKKIDQISKKMNFNEEYQFSTKIDYAKKSLYSTLNQFGYVIDSIIEDENSDTGYKINKKI